MIIVMINIRLIFRIIRERIIDYFYNDNIEHYIQKKSLKIKLNQILKLMLLFSGKDFNY